jgi:hypothetical protein
MTRTRTRTSARPRDPRSMQPTANLSATIRMRSTVEMTNGLYLLYEALSRARMRGPQDTSSEAYRAARQTAMRVRRAENRSLGSDV